MTTSGVNNPSFSFNDQCDGASYSLKKFDQRPSVSLRATLFTESE
jgi:hypothetical protein